MYQVFIISTFTVLFFDSLDEARDFVKDLKFKYSILDDKHNVIDTNMKRMKEGDK